MMKVKKINLSTSDISSLIKSLQTLSKDVKGLPDEIGKEVAELGKEYLEEEYAQATPDQTIDISDRQISVEKTGRGYRLVARGKELVYEEFGTGEEGASHPHPKKKEYPLNDYNSGPVVSTHINKYGRHYWFYNGYSEGNPSGAEVFNTARFLREKGIKDISKKKVSDVLSKV